MANTRRNCNEGHRYAEHGIGAGLTRKICKDCGLLKIGESSRVAIGETHWEHDLEGILAPAG